MSRRRHPILRLEVVAADGTREATHSVFCQRRHESIPVGVCCACVHCDEITTTPPAVVCEVPDVDGALTLEVGAVLEHGGVAIAAGASLSHALQLLEEESRRDLRSGGASSPRRSGALPVIDEASRKVIGVIRERPLGGLPNAGEADARMSMSSPFVLHERTSVRDALRALAAAHLREATVVREDGKPLGIFTDIAGLHALATER